MVLYLLVFRSLLAGIVLAVVWWLIRGRRDAVPMGPAGGFALAAGLLALVSEIVLRLVGDSILLPFQLPGFLFDWYMNYRYGVPLVIGIVGLILLSLPLQPRGGRGEADLTRRSPVSFARAWWFIAPGVLLALLLLVTVLAGAASQPDSTGRYVNYSVDLGGGRSVGATIYGWFYSIPSMILTLILLLVTFVSLSLIARPALAENRPRDIHVRTVRTRNVIAAATGALLLHLAIILGSLGATASVRGGFDTSEGTMWFWPSFAALEPALRIASGLCSVFGVALWTSVVLSGVRSRRRTPVTVGR